MQVSVVIPCFGRHQSLARAVVSVLEQTMAAHEILIVDDGSLVPIEIRDVTRDPRVKVLRHTVNSGPSAARATGVASASSDWIAFLDSDDRWLPDKLAAQSAFHGALPAPEATVSTTGWIVEDPSGEKVIVPLGADSSADFARGCWFAPGTTALMHRRAFSMAGPFNPDLRRLEDYEWMLRFGLAGGTLAVLPQVHARIGWHRTTRPQIIAEACAKIAARHLAPALSAIPDAGLQARVRSYMHLVEASALWYAGRRFGALRNLALSFAARPRFSLHDGPRFQKNSPPSQRESPMFRRRAGSR